MIFLDKCFRLVPQHVMLHALTLLQFAQNNAHSDVHVYQVLCLMKLGIGVQENVQEMNLEVSYIALPLKFEKNCNLKFSIL